MSFRQHRRKPFSDIYVSQDFTKFTSGTLATASQQPEVNEAGDTWAGNQSTYAFQSGNTGLRCTSSSGHQLALIDTLGREDVEIEWRYVLNGVSANRWQGGTVRGDPASTSPADQLFARFVDGAAVPNFQVTIGSGATADLRRWTLPDYLVNTPNNGDTVTVVVRCLGDWIILYSIQVNSHPTEIIDSGALLTGADATKFGAGSGHTRYGLTNRELTATATAERYEFFQVRAIPAGYRMEVSEVSTTGLIAWWDLVGNTNDTSGNSKNFTVNGTPTLTTDKWSASNSAYDFDSTSDELVVTPSGDSDLQQTDEFSVVFWWYRNATRAGTGSQYPFSWYSGSTQRSWYFQHQAGTNNRIQLATSANGSTVNTSGYSRIGSVTINDSWSHIAITYNAGSMSCMIDGELIMRWASPDTSLHNSTADWGWGDFGAVVGKICRCSFWERELSTREVRALYNEGNDVKYADL